RVLRIVQIGGFFQYFLDSADAGHGHGDHDDYHGEHHQAHQQGHDIAEQTCEISGGHAACHDELRDQPGDHDDAKIDCGHHSGVIEGQQSFRFDEQAVKVGGGRLKLFVFMLFPHEGLDDPDGGDVFLHTGVEVVIAAEDFVENLHGD